jgi:hypothetical protein
MVLRDAAKGRMGLSPDEIAAVLNQHLREHIRLYHGSGDGNFWMLQADIRRAMETKHPSRGYMDDGQLGSLRPNAHLEV